MTKVGIVYHTDYLLHDTGFSHPEKGERLESIIRALERNNIAKELKYIEPFPASFEILSLVHDKNYISSVKERIQKGAKTLDSGDTVVCEKSFDSALLAAGGVCSAVDAIIKGEITRAFCAVRPPGHHARKNTAMGFCIFNNIAIAARYLQMEHGVKRVAIIDWDVHHGNGTQEAFYNDSSVLYLSIHQSPHYPGTGFADEEGEGAGKGYTYNIPVFPHTSEEEYMLLFEDALESKVKPFSPEFIFISAGFDAHADDPLGNLLLTTESFRRMTELICSIANDASQGRVISVLEGGYNLDALSQSAATHVKQMMVG